MIEISKSTCMTYTDIISTLEFNHILIKNQKGHSEIVINDKEEETAEKKERFHAKPEKLTWVPYMIATKGDAGILNIPRKKDSKQHQYISSSDISIDAIIPSNSKSDSSGEGAGGIGGGRVFKRQRFTKRLTRAGKRKAAL
jgi:hypothetical protein